MDADKKASVGIAAIVAAVAVLLVVIYLFWHFTMAPKQPPVSAENAPDYAKKAAAASGHPLGGPPQSNYSQGAAYNQRPGFGGGPAGGPPGYGGAPNAGGR